ncbi:MAG: dihydropteroate synthase [Bacteroidota bacterium]
MNKPTLRIGDRLYDCSERTLIMGVLNVTPDSFSDGGRYVETGRAVEHAMEMVRQGADILDVGGESTRPKSSAYGEGADPISAEEELRRVLPVIDRLKGRIDIPISIDTYKSDVAEEALRAGAVMVNDVSGFRFDPRMPRVVAEAGACAVVMHTKGPPRTMQQDLRYDDLFGQIGEYLREGLALGEQQGVRDMVVDPGIGFGKTPRDNLRLLTGLRRFRMLGRPIMVGPSRKSFLGAILDLPVEERLEGTLASVTGAILFGADIVRVHDVREVKRAAQIADALRETMQAEQLEQGTHSWNSSE